MCSDVIMMLLKACHFLKKISKQHISHTWDKTDQQLIDSVIKQWHKCLTARVSAQAGHLEHTV